MAKARHGKRYRQWLEKVPKGPVALEEAVRIVQEFKPEKCDPTIELTMHLGIDPRQADQALRGSFSLPHGIGKTRRVIAFCEGEDAEKAKAAGAVEAGADELIQKIQDGWMDFDVAVSKPKMMRSVSRLGRILGPQGKMPSPKSGTVVEDVETAVREYSAGKVEYRNDDGGNIHLPVGKLSFEPDKLVGNVRAAFDHIKRLRPASAKGAYIRKVCIAATMSPAVLVDLS
ncbi:MAG TPA: 50S ribosomal protein L1 [Phycisphaerae bacterium]|nr:50S ribosomal protein L1 [Phycisphaerae bacterium]